jgi:hypothetical protein
MESLPTPYQAESCVVCLKKSYALANFKGAYINLQTQQVSAIHHTTHSHSPVT